MSPMPEHLLDQVSELCETVYATGTYAAEQKNRMLSEQVRELTEKLVELRRESSERLDRIQVMAHAEPTAWETEVLMRLQANLRGRNGSPRDQERRVLAAWLSRLDKSKAHRP